ncbi:MAG: extracellular solute-binding protein [Anaerolineales bacterium]
MRNKQIYALFALLVLGVLIAACGPAPVTPTAAAGVTEEAPTLEAPTEEPQPVGKVQVRWFVGLGAGTDEGTLAPQQAVVDAFNASQDKIEVVLEIVDNDVAFDTLATQIAAGNAPDIVGPVGIRGRDSFKGAWLDLQPLIDKNNYDLSDFDPAMVKFYQVKEEGQLGLPFGIYPSFVLYNADLFDEAGLNYPPAKYGDPYVWPDGRESEWNMDTLREVSMKLTTDSNGNDATSAKFDNQKITQFGWQNLWTDFRGIGTFFGAGSIVADDGKTAQIPDTWEAAWKWTYNGMWKDWFIPNGPYGAADFLQGPGGSFSSGNLAMIHIHTWYVAPWALGAVKFNWNLAATPSYNGKVTSKMHADTFCIPKGSKNPDAAFAVLSYFLSAEVSGDLSSIYGGMPARLSLQGDYFTKFTEKNFPGKVINWDVAVASIAFADIPNHESWMPAFQETTDKYTEFVNTWTNTPGLDMPAEFVKLKDALQAIFDAALAK